ncbi:MAG: PilZ domain-containing protein [Thermoanaerobaculales bacterium]|nr:PilZ domain-containing protein [Thermoanaerobaculales bacterium]
MERRRHFRHTPTRDITGKVKSTMDFRVIDISEGGMQVETRLGLPPATVCELKLGGPGAGTTLRAEIKRCRAQLTKTDGGCKVAYRSGLEFVELDDHRLETIRRLMAESCEGAAEGDAPVAVTQGRVVSGALYTV